jgi:hypothetical protein
MMKSDALLHPEKNVYCCTPPPPKKIAVRNKWKRCFVAGGGNASARLQRTAAIMLAQNKTTAIINLATADVRPSSGSQVPSAASR